MDNTKYISIMPEEDYDKMATPYYVNFYTGEGLREVTWDAYRYVP